MLDALTKFGGYRIDHFYSIEVMPDAFVLYVRGGLEAGSRYSREAKQQLYYGLALIQSRLGLENLAGVYLDVNDLENIQRPAYLQLKQDLLNGLIKRVLVLDRSALLGSPAADEDVALLYQQTGGFELFTMLAGQFSPLFVEPARSSLAR